MKIRNGFVSNSSSSSFVVLAKELNINEICSEDIKNNNIVAIGSDLYEGTDIIDIADEDMLNFFKIFKSYETDGYYQSSGDFYFYEIINNSSNIIKKEHLKDGISYELLNFYADYASSTNISDLFERYTKYNDEDVKKLLNKLLREKKLKRILK